MPRQKKEKQIKPQAVPAAPRQRRRVCVPVLPVFVLAVWAWAAWWMGDVLHVAREYSFWAPEATLMRFEDGVAWGWLWRVGRMLLTTYKWPLMGGLVVAALLGAGTWLTAFVLGLRGRWRGLAYIPAGVYMSLVAYLGFDIFFETETGRLLGLPAAVVVVLAVLALIKKLIWRKPTQEATPSPIFGFGGAAMALLVPVLISHYLRPEVRVVTTMQAALERQDWLAMQERARQDDELSYRQIAAYWAISLVKQGNLLDNLFDIRLDYDEPYLHSFSGQDDHALNYYQADCDLHAGLVETCIHHAMERLTMCGPTLHTVKLLTKCALLRGEWEAARKYLTVLRAVPFEGEFVDRYTPMLYRADLVNADPEFARIRELEPIHDIMENNLIQPAFLGYNAALTEGRSQRALFNSLAVNIYTKAMPAFMLRCQALQGQQSLPRLVGEALGVMSHKYPEVMQQYPNLELYQQHFASFVGAVSPYMADRAQYARQLFPTYKGYYGYYYFFGNLKATRKRTESSTSRQGVN